MGDRPRHKAARCVLDAYRRLLKGERLSTGELVELWEEQPRNARMWMSVLEELPEVSVEREGAQKCLALSGNRAWVTIEPELGLILALGKHVLGQFSGTRFHRRFERLFEEIDASSEGFVRRQWAKFVVQHTSAHGHPAALEEVLEAILVALESEQLITFDYTTFDGRSDTRRVEPLSLLIYGDELYLTARQRGELRFFSLFGMGKVQVLSESFTYPSLSEYDPGRLFATGLGIWPADKDETHKLTLRFSSRMSAWVRRHRWHPSQRTLDLPDGRVQVEMLLPWNPEVRRYVLGFGPDVEVLSPPCARDEIRLALDEARDRYRDDTDEEM